MAVNLDDWLYEPVFIPKPKRKRVCRAELAPLAKTGWHEYQATFTRFGTYEQAPDRWRMSVLLTQIYGSNGLYIDHCWLTFRPRRWKTRLKPGDQVFFRAKVSTYRKQNQRLSFALARPKNIRVVRANQNQIIKQTG
jgi:hypothetical protein